MRSHHRSLLVKPMACIMQGRILRCSACTTLRRRTPAAICEKYSLFSILHDLHSDPSPPLSPPMTTALLDVVCLVVVVVVVMVLASPLRNGWLFINCAAQDRVIGMDGESMM